MRPVPKSEAKNKPGSMPSAKVTKSVTTAKPKVVSRVVAKVVPRSGDSGSDESSEDEHPKHTNSALKKTSSSESESEESSEDEDQTPQKPLSSLTTKKSSIPLKPQQNISSKNRPTVSSDENSESSSEDDDKPAPAAVSKQAVDSPGEESSDSPSEEGSDSSGEESSDDTKKNDQASDSPSETSADESSQKEPVKRKASQVSPIPSKRIKLANGNQSSADPAPDPDTVKSIFVGRLSWNVDNDWLAQEFAECGEVVSASVQTDRNTGKSRGFGYVHFTTSEAVEAALALNGKEIDGRAVNVDKSHPPDNSRRENRSKAYGDETGPPSNTLFVANLAFTVKEDTLWELFGEYGAVKSVRLPTDRESGRPKGIGYIEFESVESAKKAFHGSRYAEIEGRNVRLDFAQPRDGGSSTRGGRPERGGRGNTRGGFRGFGDRGAGPRGRGRGGAGFRGGRGGHKMGLPAFEGRKTTFS